MKVALWAINGVGLGHTVRVCALASAFLRRGCKVKLLFEDRQQARILDSLGTHVEVEYALRPWKHEDVAGENSLKIRRFLSDCGLVVADMASVPPAQSFLNLVKKDTSVVFLLRWMSHRFLVERVLRRWSDFARGNVVVVLPESLFRLLLGEPLEESLPRFWFAPGFVFRSRESRSVEKSRDGQSAVRLAFTCGAGGTHSARGTDELRQALLGVAEARANLPAGVLCHAWVGANYELEAVANSCNRFDLVAPLQSSLSPDWSQYQIIFTRPSFNTIVEIMQTKAAILTGHFESDAEWAQNSLQWFEQYGVQVLHRIEIADVTRSILDCVSNYTPNDDLLMQRRRLFFRNATEDVVEQCLMWARR